MKNTNVKEVSFEPRQVTLRELKQINTHSIESDYNRNLDMKEVEKRSKKMCKKHDVQYHDELVLLLTPVMIHEHKNGDECEPHIRCILNLLSNPGSPPIVDVRIEDFESLEQLPEEVLKQIV